MVLKETAFGINEDVRPQEAALYFSKCSPMHAPPPFKHYNITCSDFFSKEIFGKLYGLVIHMFDSKLLGPRFESLFVPEAGWLALICAYF